jgi:hypothetical protein
MAPIDVSESRDGAWYEAFRFQRVASVRHEAVAEDADRMFLVGFIKCGAQGNVLVLWAAVHQLSLYEAALHLAETFHLPRNREEEPVPLAELTKSLPTDRSQLHARSGVRRAAPLPSIEYDTKPSRQLAVVTPDGP